MTGLTKSCFAAYRALPMLFSTAGTVTIVDGLLAHGV
jgi:hypothetical protein